MASSCRTNLVHKSVLGLHVFAPFSSRFTGQTPVHTQMQRSHLTSKSSDSGSWVHCPFYIDSDVSLYFSNRFAPVPPASVSKHLIYILLCHHYAILCLAAKQFL